MGADGLAELTDGLCKEVGVDEAFGGRAVVVDVSILIGRLAPAVAKAAGRRGDGYGESFAVDKAVQHFYGFVLLVASWATGVCLVFDGVRPEGKERGQHAPVAGTHAAFEDHHDARCKLATAFLRSARALSRHCPREDGVCFMVAPGESDHQIAYLLKDRPFDTVYSTDTDMLAHGAKRVVNHVNIEFGTCIVYQAPDRPAACTEPPMEFPCAQQERIAFAQQFILPYPGRVLAYSALVQDDYSHTPGCGHVTALHTLHSALKKDPNFLDQDHPYALFEKNTDRETLSKRFASVQRKAHPNISKHESKQQALRSINRSVAMHCGAPVYSWERARERARVGSTREPKCAETPLYAALCEARSRRHLPKKWRREAWRRRMGITTLRKGSKARNAVYGVEHLPPTRFFGARNRDAMQPDNNARFIRMRALAKQMVRAAERGGILRTGDTDARNKTLHELEEYHKETGAKHSYSKPVLQQSAGARAEMSASVPMQLAVFPVAPPGPPPEEPAAALSCVERNHEREVRGAAEVLQHGPLIPQIIVDGFQRERYSYQYRDISDSQMELDTQTPNLRARECYFAYQDKMIENMTMWFTPDKQHFRVQVTGIPGQQSSAKHNVEVHFYCDPPEPEPLDEPAAQAAEPAAFADASEDEEPAMQLEEPTERPCVTSIVSAKCDCLPGLHHGWCYHMRVVCLLVQQIVAGKSSCTSNPQAWGAPVVGLTEEADKLCRCPVSEIRIPGQVVWGGRGKDLDEDQSEAHATKAAHKETEIATAEGNLRTGMQQWVSGKQPEIAAWLQEELGPERPALSNWPSALV